MSEDLFWAVLVAKFVQGSDSILRLGDKTCRRVRKRVLGFVLGSFNCEVRARFGLDFSTRR